MTTVLEHYNNRSDNAFIFSDGYREKPAEDRNIVAKVVSGITLLALLYLSDKFTSSDPTFQTVIAILLFQIIFEVGGQIKSRHTSDIIQFIVLAIVLIWYMTRKTNNRSTSMDFMILAYVLYLTVEMNIKFKNSNYQCEGDKTDRNIYGYATTLCVINSLILATFILKNKDMESLNNVAFTGLITGSIMTLVNFLTMFNVAYLRDVKCENDKKTNDNVYNNATTGTIKALMFNLVPIVLSILSLFTDSLGIALILLGFVLITTTILLIFSFNCPRTICTDNDPDADNKVNTTMNKYKYIIIFILLMLTISNFTDKSMDTNFKPPILHAIIIFAMLLSSFNYQEEGVRVGLPIGLVGLTLVFLVIAKYGKK